MLKYLGKAFTRPAQGSTVNGKRLGFWTSQFEPHSVWTVVAQMQYLKKVCLKSLYLLNNNETP
jgi:hypothetical protein